MKIHKFEGATMRDAIAKVKAELGDQAVIISTRQVRRGLLGHAVEISAAIEDDLAPPPVNLPARSSGPTEPIAPRQPLINTATAAAEASEQDLGKLIDPLRSELRSLRAMVRSTSDHRNQAELRSEMMALRKLVEQLRDQPQSQPPPPPTTWSAVAEDSGLERTPVPLTAPSHGSAIMLVGPTGAGKTTTIAKLAARAALIDNRRVRVVTLDNFRVGAIDQIRIYCELIGVPLVTIDRVDDLVELLERDDTLTLIDTAGRSPRDCGPLRELAAGLRTLRRRSVEIHLVVPAESALDSLPRLAARYRPLPLARLLVTKLDEADSIASLPRMPERLELPITWVTTGQAVPEDLEQPTTARLRELALNQRAA